MKISLLKTALSLTAQTIPDEEDLTEVGQNEEDLDEEDLEFPDTDPHIPDDYDYEPDFDDE